MQFVAERGIENGLQIVTPIFLNPLNCLYTKKDCKFFQSYEKYLSFHIIEVLWRKDNIFAENRIIFFTKNAENRTFYAILPKIA